MTSLLPGAPCPRCELRGASPETRSQFALTFSTGIALCARCQTLVFATLAWPEMDDETHRTIARHVLAHGSERPARLSLRPSSRP